MSKLDKRKVLRVQNLQMFRLQKNNAEDWIRNVRAINDTLENLIAAPPAAFWSSLVYEKTLKETLNSVADFYIRVGFFNESFSYVSTENEIAKLYMTLFEKNFYVFLRILSNLPDENLSASDYCDMIYSRKIITVPILIKLCCIYGNGSGNILSSLLSNIFEIQPKFYRDLEDFIKTTDQHMENTKAYLSDLISSLENNRITRNVSHTNCLVKILDNSTNVFLSLASFVSIYQPKTIWQNLLNNIPLFIDHLGKLLTDETLARFATFSTGANALRQLAHKRTLILQSAMHLFKTLYTSNILSEKERLLTIYDAVICKEFAVRFDDEIGVKREFSRFSRLEICTDDHLKTAMKLVDEAYDEKAKIIKVGLLQKGILMSIGQPRDSQVANTLHSLLDLLPQYSPEQLHLCLRHFEYDVERTTYALMEKSELPFELRILLRHKDNFKDMYYDSVIRIPAFTDELDSEGEDEFESAEESFANTNTTDHELVTAFSLLPSTSTANNIDSTKSEEAKLVDAEKASKLATLVNKYGGMFDLSEVCTILESIDKAKRQDVEEIKFNDKLLIKQVAERRKLAADKKEPTAEEKAALRLTYDRYKYEMSDEDDEDGRYDLDARYASVVGVSGRFNKPDDPTANTAESNGGAQTMAPKLTVGVAPTSAISRFARANEDDDEYDDTYDDPELFAVNDNDASDEIDKSKPSTSTAVKKDVSSHNDKDKNRSDVGKQSKPQGSSKQQKETQKKETVRQRNVSGQANNKKSVEPSQTSSRPVQPTARYVPPFVRARQDPRPARQPSPPAVGDEPPPGFESHTASYRSPQDGRQAGAGSSHSAASKPEGTSAAYTGGKARQNKERNKNKMKQRGADRKMRGGMF